MSAAMWQDPIAATADGPILLWGFDWETNNFLVLTAQGLFALVPAPAVQTNWRHEGGRWRDASVKPEVAKSAPEDPNAVPEDLDERPRPVSG